MKLNAVVVEDEAASRRNLERLLADIDQVDIVGYADNGTDGLALIDRKQPDLIFLDINLPGYDGFELLSKLKNIPYVIFITAFNEYAVRALESNCVDYLLKPVTKDRLAAAIGRISVLEGKPNALDYDTINKLLGSFKTLKRFPVKKQNELIVLTEDDILGFRKDMEGIVIITEKEEFTYEVDITSLLTRLDPQFFMPVSDSLIINVTKIRKIRRKSICLGDKRQYCAPAGNGMLKKVKESLKKHRLCPFLWI